jgi:alpha-galactosidase/6-phospho-beta-glucosidase family protein
MTEDISMEKLTRIYIKMRDRKAELSKELEEQIGNIDDQMKAIKTAILDQMKDLGVESLRTDSGTVYRTTKTLYTTSDWESMHKFVLEHSVPELLEKRLQQTNTKAFLEEHPDLLPPGLNATTEYSVTIRRK